MTARGVQVRRIYDPWRPEDGTRALVDRVWPRGVTKDEAALDDWAKDIAPSTQLRRWYGHRVPRYDEFGVRYRDEVAIRYRDELARGAGRDALARLQWAARAGIVTWLTATMDGEHSQAVALAELLGGRR